MRIAHLIMVHKNPDQVERLLKALAHEQFDFFIHLDAKIDPKDYAHLSALPRVHFIQKRQFVRWAAYSFVEAICQSIKEIQASGTYEFINLLSGQDYPIKPAESIYQFFNQHVGCTFLSFEPRESDWWRHAITRVERYHSVYFDFKFQYKLQALANRLLPKRKFPLPYTLYGGPYGSWWTLSADSAKYLVDFIDSHAELRRFSLFTWGSDEFLVSTILMNSPLKDRIINDNYRYIDWSKGGANPKILTVNDASLLAHTYKLFARKFDTTQDAEILDVIDQSMNNSQAQVLV
ncbi:beta-1,6-N-acetylglucosaminyltransferase [Hymenobacter arizonensis]|uniref:Peptide O-xylosyltransferase n=1 Tax=Hymenobacter arizonensis TaxID=1227077 RepID=A0A1I5Z619_HYMAR|nr:beta-1,6-N-acetylglucosaminyltransferase [Hymenobacter arizonensis]SFQ51908.1 Core-2/I-Branching enzyme [Hymenobacter arizonensis]